MANTDVDKARDQSRKLAELFEQRAKLFEELRKVDDEIMETQNPPATSIMPPDRQGGKTRKRRD